MNKAMKKYTKLKVAVAVLAVLIIAAVYIITGITGKNEESNKKAADQETHAVEAENNTAQNADISEKSEKLQEETASNESNETIIQNDDNREEDIGEGQTLESEETPGASLIEDDGDIIIIIPDDMDMDGF